MEKKEEKKREKKAIVLYCTVRNGFLFFFNRLCVLSLAENASRRLVSDFVFPFLESINVLLRETVLV